MSGRSKSPLNGAAWAYPILEELGCERHGNFFRQRDVATVESCPDRIAQKIVVDGHVREDHVHVVEVLHPAV